VKPFLSETTKPAQPNLPIPEGVKADRVPPGAINSKNEAGGYVAPDAFKQPKG
jgi:hypothetical protein